MFDKYPVCRILLAVGLLLAAAPSQADIYQWTISDGTVTQSNTLCPSGSGVNAAPGANLAGLDLTQAYLIGADLGGASLYNTMLASADMTGANLSKATLYGATLTDATLTNATVVGAQFGSTSLSASQLYSTASYQAHYLQGIGLDNNNLTGWNLAAQNLFEASFPGTTLAGADLSAANLNYADFFNANLTGATLSGANLQQAGLTLAALNGANLSAADLRGSVNFNGAGADLTNSIGPTGTIAGLDLSAASPLLVVRDSAIAIHVITDMSITGSGSLQAVLDGTAWRSTISFDPGIPVALGGSLDLQVAAGVDPASLVGHSLQLFDWTGVTPLGQFDQIAGGSLPPNYNWDTSMLYQNGTIALALSTTGDPVNTVTGEWATNGGGTWSARANWTGGSVPKSPQDTALFGTALTDGTANVTLDTPVSLAGAQLQHYGRGELRH